MCRDPFGIGVGVKERLEPIRTHSLGVSKSHSGLLPAVVYCLDDVVLEAIYLRDRSQCSRIGCSSRDRDHSYDYLHFGLNIVMAKKFTQYLVDTRPLYMLTAQEVKDLARSAQQTIAVDNTLLFKYRLDFLHIQDAAAKGLTKLDILSADPNEFKIIADAWGFSCTVGNLYTTNTVYTTGLTATDVNTLTSNVTVDWSNPRAPVIDVEFFRNTGNLSYVVTTASVLTTTQNKLGLSGISNVSYIGKTPILGTGAIWTINTVRNTAYSFKDNVSAGGGTNYSVGNVISIAGQYLGGNNQNGATITVTAVKDGKITASTIAGTANTFPGMATHTITANSNYLTLVEGAV